MTLLLAWGLIGMCVGVIMGLTGAGGAVVSVPLFVFLTGASVLEATTYSLYTVLIGATFNWFFQRKDTVLIVSGLMAAFSFGGSALFTDIKTQTPEWGISLLFSAVCLFSLWTIWRPFQKKQNAPQTYMLRLTPLEITKFAASGIVLGALTTMTGLGGGVLLIPWLIGPLKMPMVRAIPTSLLAISIAALGSLGSQFSRVAEAFDLRLILALILGTLMSTLLTRTLLGRLSEQRINASRKIVFSTVLALAVASVLFLAQK